MQTFLSLVIELSEIAPQKRNKKTFQLPGLVQKYRFWFNMFAYSHAMINPMIYITFNDNFKKAFKKVIFCSNEEIPSEHSSDFIFTWFFSLKVSFGNFEEKIISPFSASFQRQFSWKRTFSRRRGTDTGKNIEIRWALSSCNNLQYMLAMLLVDSLNPLISWNDRRKITRGRLGFRDQLTQSHSVTLVKCLESQKC